MSIDTIDRPDTELVTLPAETALEVFTDPAKLDPYLAKIRAAIDAFEPDLSTASSRKDVASFSFRVTKSKTYLLGIGKKLYEQQSQIPKKIAATNKLIETRLDAWRDEARKPLTDWEFDENARKIKHESAIAEIARQGSAENLSAAALRERIAALSAIDLGDRCEEFVDGYTSARDRALVSLNAMLALRERYESEQAELARLRAEDAKRKAAEAEQAAKDKAAAKAKAAEQMKAWAAQAEADVTPTQAAPVTNPVIAPAPKTAPAAPRQSARQIAASALCLHGIDEAIALKVIDLIADGKVPNVSILYSFRT